MCDPACPRVRRGGRPAGAQPAARTTGLPLASGDLRRVRRPRKGFSAGKASEPVPKQPFASTSRRPPSARSFGVQGARWSSSPGTGMNAASGAQRGDSQRWGHVGQTLRGPAPDRFAGCGEAGSPTLPQSRASASRGVAFGRCRTPVIPGGGRSRSPREGREGSAVDDLGRRSA